VDRTGSESCPTAGVGVSYVEHGALLQ